VILVDSSVWVDFLQSAHSHHQASLGELIRLPRFIGVPGPVVQEVLQGIRDERMFHQLEERLRLFPVLHADTETYVMAARLYRTLMRHGSVVPPGDVTIAALAIQSECELYTLDQHFQRIQRHSALRLYRPTALQR
jgi:predicted nucleic acid-binding protein